LDTGASWIYHESNERFIPVKFSVRERDLGSTVAEAQERIAKNVKLPTGYRLVWAGEFGQLQAAKARFAVIVPVTLVLILGLLYALFNKLRESLLALSGMPFVIAGGVLALFFSGLNFSISAAIGFISLFGVSVMKAYYNQLLQRRGTGLGPTDATDAEHRQLYRAVSRGNLAACAVRCGDRWRRWWLAAC